MYFSDCLFPTFLKYTSLAAAFFVGTVPKSTHSIFSILPECAYDLGKRLGYWRVLFSPKVLNSF